MENAKDSGLVTADALEELYKAKLRELNLAPEPELLSYLRKRHMDSLTESMVVLAYDEWRKATRKERREKAKASKGS